MIALDTAVLALKTDGQQFFADLDKAERKALGLGESFERAKQAEKSLIESTRALSSALDDVFGTSLEARARAVSTGIMQIGGASKLTDAEVRQHLGTLDNWIAKAARVGKEVPSHILQTRDALQKVADEGKRVPTIWDTISAKSVALGAAVGSFLGNIAFSAVSKLSGEVQEFIANGAKLPAVQSSFTRLATGIQQDSGAMLGTLQQSTRGLVSNLDLMQAANKAMLLGLPVTTQSLGDMADAAVKLGRAMGQDATKSLDDMITALGRQSPMILDNLGLTVKVSEANEAYARRLGKTADQLTDGEKKLAFYEAAMEAARRKSAELGEQTLTLGEIAQSVWTKIGNVVTTGAGVINTQVGKILSSKEALLEFLRLLALTGSTHAALTAMELEDRRAASQRPAGRKRTPGNSDAFQFEELQRAAKAASEQGIKPLTETQRELSLQFLAGGESAKEIATRLNAVKMTAGVTEEQIEKLQEQQREAQKAADEQAEAIARLEAAKRPLTDTQRREVDILLQLGHGHSDIAKALKVSEVAVRNFDEAQKAHAKSAKAWGDLHEGMVATLGKLTKQTIDLAEAREAALAKGRIDDNLAQLKAIADVQERMHQQTMTASERRIRQIDLEHRAAVLALGERKGAEDRLYDEAKAMVDAFYAHQRRVALGTTDTLVDRMRAAGVATRQDLIQTAREAERDYEQMKASGLFTAEEIQRAFERMQDALRRASLRMRDDWKAAFDSILGSLARVGGAVGAAASAVLSASRTIRDARTMSNSQRAAGTVASLTDLYTGTGQEGQSTANSTISGAGSGAAAGALIGAKAAPVTFGLSIAAGALIGGLVGYFRGREANAERKKVDDQRDEFLGQFGRPGTGAGSGFAELARQLHELGPLGDQLFQRVINARTMDDFAAASAAAEKALAFLQQRLQKFNDGLTDHLTRIRDLGGGLPDSIVEYLNGLRDAGQLTETNIGLLAELTGGGAVKWQAIEEAANRYGIAQKNLGASFHELKLHDAWQQLIDDIDLFTRGNVNVDALLTDMSDDISALVQQSIKFGTEIPENMRPWIQKLIDAGQLVDENGDKITDIGKLKFGETLQTSLQNLIDKIGELIDAFRQVPGAAAAAANAAAGAFGDDGKPSPSSHVDQPQPSDQPDLEPYLMAEGGDWMVRKPTLFMAGEAGPERATFTPMKDLQRGLSLPSYSAASLLGAEAIDALNAGRTVAARASMAIEGMVQHITVNLDNSSLLRAVRRGLPRDMILHGVWG